MACGRGFNSPRLHQIWHPKGCHEVQESPKGPSQSTTWAFFLVRPAWAHSYGCKSRRKLITTNEAKRTVMFEDRDGRSITGVAVRINQRTATIGTGDGGNWRVPFHMLRHVLDI